MARRHTCGPDSHVSMIEASAEVDRLPASTARKTACRRRARASSRARSTRSSRQCEPGTPMRTSTRPNGPAARSAPRSTMAAGGDRGDETRLGGSRTRGGGGGRPDSRRAITSSVNAAARAPSTTRWSKVTETLPIWRTTISPSTDDGARGDPVDAEDADLGVVDERRDEEPAELAGARDGEGAAAQLLRRRACRRAPPRRAVDLRGEARRARRVSQPRTTGTTRPWSVWTATPRS